MNLVSFILCSTFVVLVFGYDSGSSYVTRSEHIVPHASYHQQDHHENSELNQEIYVHENHNDDEVTHGGANGGYGFSYGQQEQAHGGEESGNLQGAHGLEHSYGHEDSGSSYANYQDYGNSDGSEKNQETHTNEGNKGHESAGHGDEHKNYYHHPAYKYEYGVDDPKTKDRHSHWEQRDGDVVKGQYTLDEPDGTIRKVSYSSDKHNGFTAHVEKIGQAVHPATHEEHHHESANHQKASQYDGSDRHY